MPAIGKSIALLDDLYKAGLSNTQSLINTVFADMYQESFWKRYFDKDGMPTPSDSQGVATFRAIEMIAQSAPMLEPRARWSEPTESPKGSMNYYTGSIGDFGRSFSITPEEEEYYQVMLEMSGGDVNVLTQYVSNINDLVKGAHATISNLSAQLMSKGQMISANTTGFKFQGIADIPAARFKKAGAKVWSDISSDILTKMQTEEDALRTATGFTGMLTWKMDKTTFQNIQLNTAVRSQVGSYLNYNNILFTTNSIVTLDAFNQWAVNVGNLSVIELVEEKQMLNGGQTSYYTTTRGWKAGSAVLSPAGKQGVIKYSNINELAKLANYPNKQVAYLENGLFGIMNWLNDSGRSPVRITELLIAIAPALSVYNTMTIVDTTTADS